MLYDTIMDISYLEENNSLDDLKPRLHINFIYFYFFLYYFIFLFLFLFYFLFLFFDPKIYFFKI